CKHGGLKVVAFCKQIMLMNVLASGVLFLFIGPFKHVSAGETKEAGKSAHAILIVRATDKIRSTSLILEILSKDDKVLSNTTVTPIGTSGAHFMASFATPTVPFKLKLRGKTKKNFNFERNSANIVHPSRVLVRVLYARSEFTVPIRGRGLVIFFVYNTDSTEIFKFKVEDSSTFDATVLRPQVRVYKNRSGFSQVHRNPKFDTHGHFCLIFGNIAIFTKSSTLISKIIVAKLNS
ncbi:hypothetical protein ACROYT_G007411, partial [Oculina patagonica]